VVVIVKFKTTKEANNNVSRKGNNEKMKDLIIMCWSLLQHGNRLSNAVERVTWHCASKAERKKKEMGHASQRCMSGWQTPQPRLEAVVVNNDEQEGRELFVVVVDQ
jgi:hypothetical protein